MPFSSRREKWHSDVEGWEVKRIGASICMWHSCGRECGWKCGVILTQYVHEEGSRCQRRRAVLMKAHHSELQENSPRLIRITHSKFTSLQREEDRGLCTRHKPHHLSHTETYDCGCLPISQSYMIASPPGLHTSHFRLYTLLLSR
jgi:hypothetical protein